MDRKQLDSRIRGILSQLDNQTTTVEKASEEVGNLIDGFFQRNDHEDQEKTAV